MAVIPITNGPVRRSRLIRDPLEVSFKPPEPDPLTKYKQPIIDKAVRKQQERQPATSPGRDKGSIMDFIKGQIKTPGYQRPTGVTDVVKGFTGEGNILEKIIRGIGKLGEFSNTAQAQRILSGLVSDPYESIGRAEYADELATQESFGQQTEARRKQNLVNRLIDVMGTQEAQEFRGEQAGIGREAKAEQAELGREFRGEQAKIGREATAEQAGLVREARTEEAKTGREFTAEQAGLGREFRGEQAGLGREATAEQAGLGRKFTAEQAGIGREFRGEQAGLGREFTAEQTEKSREFKRVEAERDRAIKSSMAKLSAAAKAEQNAAKSKTILFKGETSLRKEYDNLASIEDSRDVLSKTSAMLNVYRNYLKDPKRLTGTLDQILITTIGKTVDPGSVVREGEYNRTEKGIPFRDILAKYREKMVRGGTVTDEMRADIVEKIEQLVAGHFQSVIGRRAKYVDLSKDYGFNAERIVGKPIYFETEADVEKAGLPDGTVIVIGSRVARWRK